MKQLRVQDDLPATTLLNLLTFTPLQGTSLVDLAFTHGDPRLAASVVNRYATESSPSATRPRKTASTR